jgi:catechol 2,3-dioxygenase-like lactoylglutathione lyase family enzyme
MTSKPAEKRTLSSRAKRSKVPHFAERTRLWLASGTVACALVVLCAANAAIAKSSQRPKISGIAGVTLLVSDLPGSREKYKQILQPGYSCDWCEEGPTADFKLGAGQTIALQAAPTPNPDNLLDEVFFKTADLKAMKRYLRSQNVPFEELSVGRASLRIRVKDPDGHHISFISFGPITAPGKDEVREHAGRVAATAGIPGYRIIHAGFIVRNQSEMDHFYKDILGFRPYWHGGMKDDETSWISLQVPDGTDWIEYMVNLPADPDQHLRGVMNHIAIGVVDIQAEREQLVKNGVHLTEEPKLGRDGKWQLNLYDPDQTRIEFMEFTPKEKPCCSEYTGPHPKP